MNKLSQNIKKTFNKCRGHIDKVFNKDKINFEDDPRFISFDDRLEFPKKVTRTLNYEIKMMKQFDDNIWLWETNDFVNQLSEEIREHKFAYCRATFGEYIRYAQWLSVRLKMTGEEEIIKLIQEYVKFGIKHYDAEYIIPTDIKDRHSVTYPEMILNAYFNHTYGYVSRYEIYDKKSELANCYLPEFMPIINENGQEIVGLTEDGTELVLKKYEPLVFNSDEEIEKFLEDGAKKIVDSLPEEQKKRYFELMKRVEDNDNC